MANVLYRILISDRLRDMRCFFFHFSVPILIFGLAPTFINRSMAQEKADAVNLRRPGGLVEVEPRNFAPTSTAGGFELSPYNLRRGKWGRYVGLSAGNFAPLNHEPEFFSADFADVYPTEAYAYYELNLATKRNFSMGSISLDFGAGVLSLTSNSDFDGSSLQIIPIRLGLSLNLDNLFSEPYFVPFFGGGVYTDVYTEKLDGTEKGGNTQAALYMGGGLLIQINWIDPISSRDAYLDSGIENTFLVFEVRNYLASGGSGDPDYSSQFYNLGFKVEL